MNTKQMTKTDKDYLLDLIISLTKQAPSNAIARQELAALSRIYREMRWGVKS
jgi:hypothetical protein